MAKKPSKATPHEGELEQAPKKGLFSFLRRKKKKQSQNQLDDQAVTAESADSKGDEAVASAQRAAAKKPATKPVKSAGKTAAKKKPTTAKKAPAKKVAASAKKAGGAQKQTRGKAKKQAEKPQIAATADNADEEVLSSDTKKKRSLFGFLKRKKKVKVSAEEQVLAKEAADNQSVEKKPKKKLFGFLKRKKETEEVVEDALVLDTSGNIPVGTGMIDTEIEADDASPIKKGIFTKKFLIIILSGFALTATSGAAAVVFVKPGFLDNGITGLACDVVHEVDFELMKENRVTSFIRAGAMPTKERVLMVLNYTKYLVGEYPDSQLVTVSLLDVDGPTSRPDFRGSNIGAQVVFAPDPLLTQATKKQWEVRYVNADRAYGGKFIGDRYELSPDEIKLLSEEIIEPSGCYVPEEEMSEEELAEKERLEAEALAAEEAEQAALEAEAEKNAEPGMIDNVLALVGLGGSDEEEMTPEDAMMEENANIYPGDKAEMEEAHEEDEAGFLDGILQMVGFGSDDHAAQNEQKVDVLGTKIRYN
ncbi:MAG: hypothetical protein ABJE63_12610 [Lentilitoribacter sp.]